MTVELHSCSLSTLLRQLVLAGVKQLLAKFHNVSLDISDSPRNLGFIFDSLLTFSDQISALTISCCYHIRELRCISHYLDFKTASTIDASIVHSRLITAAHYTTIFLNRQ